MVEQQVVAGHLPQVLVKILLEVVEVVLLITLDHQAKVAPALLSSSTP
jgi:hypothetical protein